jgi:hypothetical protein
MIKLKPVPERIRCPLDGVFTVEVQEKIDNFFAETKNYLEEKFGKSPYFEIKSKNMELSDNRRDKESSDNKRLSDNRITYLLYNDHCVAGVFERRTEFNNLEYIFFRNLKNTKYKLP